MNSTNFESPDLEKEKILEICSKLATENKCDAILSSPSADAESYYCNRNDVRLFESELFDFDFSTPVELRTLLTKMWEYQSHECMKEFAVVATVATFKNKAESTAHAKASIPAFIYNF